MTENKFIEEINKLGISLTKQQLNQLNMYYELLVEWNKKMNLTGITEKDQVYLKHFYDSLTISKVVDLTKEKTLIDVGTGAGFPGLVLKIVFPNLNVTLLDSLNKRLNFLNEVIKKLELKNITTIHDRCEEYAIKTREKYDIVTARAVAPLPILIEYCVPLVKVNKFFIPMKANIEEEIINSSNAIKKLEIKSIKKETFKLPIEESTRTIIKFQKINKTSKMYARKYNEIKKRSL